MKKHEHGGKGTGLFVNTKKVISSILDKDGYFLDVGCGPGDYLVSASKISDNLTGIDIHEESIHKVKGLGFNGLLVDVTKKTPFSDNSFDSILISNVLHGFCANHIDKKVLLEIKRVLKKNGKLGIVEFKKNALIGPPKEIKLSDNQVEIILNKLGFSKLELIDVGMFNYMLVFRKKD